jgi:hypothetical protein
MKMCLEVYVMQLPKTPEESRGKRFFEVIVEACVNRQYSTMEQYFFRIITR